jgi:hypothetical protein
MGQDVPQARVRGLLVGDDDGSVAPRPKTLAPQVQSPGHLGHVGVHELHEPGKLAGARRGQQEMRVVRQEDESVDGHAVQGLGPADDAQDQVGELR